MILFDRMLTGGLRFVLESIVSAVEAELDDEERLREELLAAEMRRELGELDEGEFAAVEAELLGRLRVLREERLREAGLVGGETLSGGVTVDVELDEGLQEKP